MKIGGITAPCHKCESRMPNIEFPDAKNCHTDCPLYLDYTKTMEKVREARFRQSIMNSPTPSTTKKREKTHGFAVLVSKERRTRA